MTAVAVSAGQAAAALLMGMGLGMVYELLRPLRPRFTALSDGLTSALIAFLRTLVFQIAAVLLLPLVWDVDGIWASVIAAELAACVLGIVFIAAKRKKFGY